MKKSIIYSFLLLLSHTVSAQKYTAIDKVALKIPDSMTTSTAGIARYVTAHFTTDEEKARAIFIWIASNIQYDLPNMFAINFYETKEEKIAKPLRTRKGICENYAAVFNDVCLHSGIRSYVIEGYTKQNWVTDYIPHAWCAAMINNSWYLFDPTWGSGYINNKKFYKKINDYYFKAQPAVLIRSHMPFDYLWQFLPYPVTNQEFMDGKTGDDKSKPYFSYPDSLAEYEGQTSVQQLHASAARIEKNGVKNSLVFDRLQHIKMELENTKVNSYNGAVMNYNEGINQFNTFIQYRNVQFEPKRSDAAIQDMLDSSANELRSAIAILNSIQNTNTENAALVKQLTRSVNDAMVHVNEQEEWLKKYFSKGKVGRHLMFNKYTWLGMPLN
ncbi:MAG: hypothetical protein H0X33_00295 [Taibaiella sp.]|nr:hypothetical protein [Taibaiella sp.]